MTATPRKSPPDSTPRPRGARAAAWIAGFVLLASLTSCAYYNTFYTARRYYSKATDGLPYRADKTDSPDLPSLNKSIDHSKKLMANYPKSKWVDDAYLLWAKGFLAKNDPLQTVTMLQDFSTRYPNSPLKHEALFYKGVALRQARRPAEGLLALDEYLKESSGRDPLLPYAHLERARALRTLERYGDAAAAAGELVQRWPKSPLAVTARIARAESYLAQGEFERARADFHFLGERSRDDDERLNYLLRESECLEGGRRLEESLALLRGALSHERPPALTDTTGGRPLSVMQVPGYDRYGRLLTRVGSVQLMSGNVNLALESYRRVVQAYPHTSVSAEAQFRIGYAYEIGADDFEKARVEYALVKDQFQSSPFATQAAQRLTTLDQLARFRSAGGDSLDRRAEAGFLLAEQYLFQFDKPERALVEYTHIAEEHAGTPWAGKALNAQAWVLSRKLNKPADAESLLWKVVREYPATEAQLAARDYLENLHRTVPAEWIKLPPPPALKRDSLGPAGDLQRSLTAPPSQVPPLGSRLPATLRDSMAQVARARSIFGGRPMLDSAAVLRLGPGGRADSLAPRFPRDSAGVTGANVPEAPAVVAPPGVSASGLGLQAAVAPDTARAAPTGPSLPAPPASLAVPLATGGRDSLVASVRPDTAFADTARVPLPPLELSPVRPGITFPRGRPRTLGYDSGAASSGPAAARPSSAPGTRRTPTRAPLGAPAPPDTTELRGPRSFEPRGTRFQ